MTKSKVVYHGSKEKFSSFDFSKIGLNGTSEGKGIYFTDNLKVARSYGEGGFLYTVNFKGKKSLSDSKLTINKKQLEKFMIALDEENEYLSNYGDKGYEGLKNVLNTAIEAELHGSDNDVDLISGIVNANGDIEEGMQILHDVLGYDSIVCEAEWGNQTLYIALIDDVIEILEVEEL